MIYYLCYHLTSLNTYGSINNLFIKASYKSAHVTYPEIPSEKVKPPPTHTSDPAICRIAITDLEPNIEYILGLMI